MADELAGAFRLPFPEQIAALRVRFEDLKPTARWDDLRGAEHDRAFMVAGAVKADLLADLAAAVDRAVAEGSSLEEFRRDFRDIVERHGWHGWTGEGTKAGEAWRTRVIYRTNVATTYAAGRMAQLRGAGFPLWIYRHSGAEHPRLDHLSWDGLVLASDHPFWQKHYPPNGWGCGCRVAGARSERGARRLGGDPSKPLPPGWDTVSPKTGTPPGIGKGWDHAPGDTVSDTILALTEKAVNWDYSLATAYMRSLPDAAREEFSAGYRRLPSLADTLRKYAEEAVSPAASPSPQRTLGLAPAGRLSSIGVPPGANSVYEYVVTLDSVQHIFKRHGDPAMERSRGQRAVSALDFGRLGAMLNDPDLFASSGLSAAGVPVIRVEKVFGNERVVALFEVRTGRRRIALVTMWVESVGRSPTATP